MSAQVDVLAVLDATILAAEADARMYKLDDAAKAVAVFKATRAAVAALIAERDALREALKSLRGVVPYFWHDDSPHIGELDEACEAADNALAITTGESA